MRQIICTEVYLRIYQKFLGIKFFEEIFRSNGNKNSTNREGKGSTN